MQLFKNGKRSYTLRQISLLHRFTQGRKNRNEKLLIQCSPTIKLWCCFYFKNIGQWPVFYSSSDLWMFLEKMSKLSTLSNFFIFFFAIIKNNKTIHWLENDKIRRALIISYFIELFQALFFNLIYSNFLYKFSKFYPFLPEFYKKLTNHWLPHTFLLSVFCWH